MFEDDETCIAIVKAGTCRGSLNSFTAIDYSYCTNIWRYTYTRRPAGSGARVCIYLDRANGMVELNGGACVNQAHFTPSSSHWRGGDCFCASSLYTVPLRFLGMNMARW
ncbi:hypothetical protein BCR44DRAFT_43977 [Catenaria anguillulae PL171]|uniref:Uncharacterized protein n=1 Tax=Catenaria anguillulae PL171 TaxID=765915 RepID=A0A1Y2HC16_9FUNG|nr:hypothetical protein BCR44DRAFT_43977 [Catenaria anguillulae PL171]